ncbi:MAG TPA: hypothetical protein PKX07_01585 [Aggregatilineales bacterium]|nr:hypothetical protein [Aggregatilineales bacterium]
MPSYIYDTIGMIGVVIILSTYLLLQMERLKSETLLYSVLNMMGSSMILFSLFFEWNLASAIIEGAWVLVSLFGIVRYFVKRRATSAARA